MRLASMLPVLAFVLGPAFGALYYAFDGASYRVQDPGNEMLKKYFIDPDAGDRLLWLRALLPTQPIFAKEYPCMRIGDTLNMVSHVLS